MRCAYAQWFACALAAACCASAAAQTPWKLEVVGGWGGPINEFERHGDIGYAAIGQRLVTLDMADPTSPFEIVGLDPSRSVPEPTQARNPRYEAGVF
jgi:hypothetical protein